MVTAEHDGNPSVIERAARASRHFGADIGDGAEESRAALRATRRVLTERHFDIPRVINLMTKLLEAITEIGVADG